MAGLRELAQGAFAVSRVAIQIKIAAKNVLLPVGPLDANDHRAAIRREPHRVEGHGVEEVVQSKRGFLGETGVGGRETKQASNHCQAHAKIRRAYVHQSRDPGCRSSSDWLVYARTIMIGEPDVTNTMGEHDWQRFANKIVNRASAVFSVRLCLRPLRV